MSTSGQGSSDQIRLAELLAALSLVTDLARGHPPEEAMRACLLATHLGGRMGLSQADQASVYYTTLLRYIGCTATSHEYTAVFGDDVAARRHGDMADATVPKDVIALLLAVTRGDGNGLGRARRLAVAASAARKTTAAGARADCEVGARMAGRFRLGPQVSVALDDIFERWDGKGAPRGKRQDEIALPARFAAVAFTAVMFDEVAGAAAAAETVRRWSGRILDPSIAAAFDRDALEASVAQDALVSVVQAEPGARHWVSEAQFDEVARGFAELVDLKSPYLHGHAEGVASLAEAAGRLLGLDTEATRSLRRAGLLHDLGRAAVPTGVWEKPGPLSTSECSSAPPWS